MIYKEFDTIIDTIEENLTLPWEAVESILKSALAMTSQQIGQLFRYFYPDDVTINRYHKDRKAFRTMDAIIKSADESMDSVIYCFGYSDYSVFYKTIKKLLKKSPQQLLEEGNFKVPKLIHLEDAVKDINYDFKNQVNGRKNLEDYKDAQISLVDRIKNQRDWISELEMERRNTRDKCEMESLEEEIARLKNAIAREEETLASYKLEPVYIKNLTVSLYAEFVKIEDCRAIYGLDISKIVKLYNQSIETGMPLSVLCDIESDKEYFDDDFDEDDYIGYEEDWEEEYLQFQENEMNLAESWQYFKDDYADDPYAEIEEPEDLYYL